MNHTRAFPFRRVANKDEPVNRMYTYEELLAEAPEQEHMEEWIMKEVEKGAALPGLYPMNAETKARYEGHRSTDSSEASRGKKS